MRNLQSINKIFLLTLTGYMVFALQITGCMRTYAVNDNPYKDPSYDRRSLYAVNDREALVKDGVGKPAQVVHSAQCVEESCRNTLNSMRLHLLEQTDAYAINDINGVLHYKPMSVYAVNDNSILINNDPDLKIISVGDDTLVMIKKDVLFYPATADLSAEGEALLDRIGDRLNSVYPKNITIVTRTADIGEPDAQYGLTSYQANAIAHYLQRVGELHNVPMTTLALASKEPLASRKTTYGRADNNSVIIHFSKSRTPKPFNYYQRFVLSPYQYEW